MVVRMVVMVADEDIGGRRCVEEDDVVGAGVLDLNGFEGKMTTVVIDEDEQTMAEEDGGGEGTTWWESRERRHTEERKKRGCVFFYKNAPVN